jgi:hypothetical protein
MNQGIMDKLGIEYVARPGHFVLSWEEAMGWTCGSYCSRKKCMQSNCGKAVLKTAICIKNKNMV